MTDFTELAPAMKAAAKKAGIEKWQVKGMVLANMK